MKVLFLGADFMLPYWRPEVEAIAVNLHEPLEPQLDGHQDAAFAYAMNTLGGENVPKLWAARDACRRLGIRTVWHTIEDPNSFGTFLPQAEGFDLIATSDAEKIPAYQEHYPTVRTIWLPLAAQPALHRPRPQAPDGADLVLIANWYTNDARLSAVRELLDPLLDDGLTLALYAYPHPAWPDKYRRWWRGATSCYDVATYYPTGRLALGMNNQAYGTAMCSMRAFEVLACGMPFLSFHSDAYARLGFLNAEGEYSRGHFAWVHYHDDAVRWARTLLREHALATVVAENGRRFVLEHHTYAHRLKTLLEALG
jgi:spore maturation protein CgeB